LIDNNSILYSSHNLFKLFFIIHHSWNAL